MGEKCFHNLKPVDNRIWKYRHICNLSQQEIGRLLEYKTTSQISNWEKGKKLPTLINALRLSEILHTTVEALFPGLAQYLKNEIEAKAKRLEAKYSH